VPRHAIRQPCYEVGDHPGHTYSIAKGECTWTTPLEIAGLKTTGDSATDFMEMDVVPPFKKRIGELFRLLLVASGAEYVDCGHLFTFLSALIRRCDLRQRRRTAWQPSAEGLVMSSALIGR
jgi:hypothetical protein